MLTGDVLALKRITAIEKPAVTRCRTSELMTAFYLLWNASGQGFVSCLWGHEGLRCDSENWSTQWKNETSNWKEGTNLNVIVKELAKEQKLDNGEIFILIDNQVFEEWFYKGNSKYRKLNELVLRLRLVEMGTGYTLHVIHVAGTRTKIAGIDGLSQGDLLEGMMTCQNPLDFIPLNG